MADLSAMAADAGFDAPRTLMASGNLVLGSGEKSADRVARELEREAERRLGLRTVFFVRSAAEWQRIIAENPFEDAAAHDPSHLIVLALADAPAASAEKALNDAIVGRETVRVLGRVAYAVYPDGIGDSKLTAAVIERKLGTQCTGRNWNTVLKLGALASARG
jgi:uncharacterized protein (DUF1697 family)